MKDIMTEPFITSYSGKDLYFNKLTPDVIDINDIAHSLSMQCRFNGHCEHFYSIAQHSVLVSRLVSKPNKLIALLHDAPEYIIGDLVSPVKRTIGGTYKPLEQTIMNAIGWKFKLSPYTEICTIPQEVKWADMVMYENEMYRLMKPNKWNREIPDIEIKFDPQPQVIAKEYFLKEFHRLTNE